MSDFNDLIHDARQVDLEEMIMTNETPMYLVPGRLTDEQDTVIRRNMIGGPILDPADMFALLVRTIGTPIQPCADVETVGWVDPDLLRISMAMKRLSGMVMANAKTVCRTVPLVRRTDMAAQVARVAAEKDAEIARLKDALIGIDIYAGDTLSGPADGPMYEKWLKVGVQEIRHRARAALNEGGAG